MPLDDTTKQFLTLLHRGSSYAYFWTIEGRQSFWWPIGRMPALPHGKRNIYVGVHGTTSIPATTPRGEPAEPRALRAQLPYIAAINCLYCEYDAKDFSGDKEEARKTAEQMNPIPSVIVDSGGGYHVYHLLDEPWILATDDDRQRAKRLQAAWVAYAGSDPQVKDLARVLRIPGTLNYKYDPPRPVSFLVAALNHRYRLSDLESVCAHLMEPERPVDTLPARVAPEDRKQRYARGALDREVANVLRAQSGKKHDTIRDAALKLGTFVPLGLLTEDEIVDELTRAADLHREDVRDTYRTVLDGIAYGKQRPRTLPEPAPSIPLRSIDRATGEILEPDQQAREYVVDWRKQGITLAELQHKDFPPERWIIEGILPEGACLLAAKYKSKKSWVALALGLAISMGGKALGRMEVFPGRVLYLDLEGKQQRIKKRTRAILGVQHVDWPANFHVFEKWPQGEEGLRELENWFASYPDTVYVVIDVLADFRRPIEKHEQPYQYDRTTVQPMNELFERYHAAGLLVHHFNKAKNDDIMDSISGTTGLPSAVGTMWGLARDVGDSSITVLHLRGRDLENDEPIALKWDSYLNQHVVEGPASEVSISGERKAILTILSDDIPRTPKEIATDLGRPVTAVQFLLRKLLNDGLIDKPVYGKYARIPQAPQSAQTPQTPQSAQSAQSYEGKETDSERTLSTLRGVAVAPQSSVSFPTAVNGNSEHSERHDKSVRDPTPLDRLPEKLRMTTSMMLASDLERNQDTARERCEQYGIDFEQARAWAIERSKGAKP